VCPYMFKIAHILHEITLKIQTNTFITNKVHEDILSLLQLGLSCFSGHHFICGDVPNNSNFFGFLKAIIPKVCLENSI